MRHQNFLALLVIATSANLLAVLFSSSTISAGVAEAQFYLGINVNGRPVRIDGHQWQGGNAERLKCNHKARVADRLQLRPSTDAQHTEMIRSFQWNRDAHLQIADVPDGTYSVALYLLEDNRSQRFDVYIESLPALRHYESGPAGTWRRVGPWAVEVTDGTIDITSQGGDANFSGVEVWKGNAQDAVRLEAKAPPTSPFLGRSSDQKPRIVVMTDIGGDPDDEQSLVRFLLYACDFDVEGLCTGFGHGHYRKTRPELLHRGVDAYSKVFESLRRHHSDYPTPEQLRSLIRDGHNGDPHSVGPGMDSDASNWIIGVLEKHDPRPVWFSIWGGPRELAQALWRMQQTKSGQELAAIKKKIRVHSIADQDQTAGWIKKHHPDVFWIYSRRVFRGIYAGGDLSSTSPEWLMRNVLDDHGALGGVYPPRAAGKTGVKEGDTSSFLYVLRNGLSDPEAPSWGNWGGRFRYSGSGMEYLDAVDSHEGDTSKAATIHRWRQAFQNELEARMDWCVQPPEEANHAPVAVCGGQRGVGTVQVKAEPGSEVTLDASESSDPDGDKLTFHWWIYPEPSGLTKGVTIERERSQKALLLVPNGAQGKTLHVVLEVTDTGKPALTSYRRILVQCDQND